MSADLARLLGTGGARARATLLDLGPDPARIAASLMRGRLARGSGRYGAIATSASQATQAGMELLAAGGTAADAAAGAALALMVCDPVNASPAGRAHILWDAPGRPPGAIDGATQAPMHLPPDAPPLPLPGAVRAVLRLHAEAGRLPLAQIAAPARNLADQGFVPGPELAQIWALRAPDLSDADARRIYLPGGAAPEVGARFCNPGLAAFFDRMIVSQSDPFADPDFADAFARRLAAKGAAWRGADLTGAAPLEGEIIARQGSGWQMTTIGRQGWGHTMLRILGQALQNLSAAHEDRAAAFLTAVLRALEERPEELRSLQPKSDPIPWDRLAGDPAAPSSDCSPAALRDLLARQTPPAIAEDRDTTHLSAIDATGMRVALTQSIGPHFGARIADPQTGILIAHSYRMAVAPIPGARDVTEQCPCLLNLHGARYALGAAGSERIPGAVAAVAAGLIGGDSLDRAMAAPRANWAGDTARIHIDAPEGLEARLAAAGARVQITGRGPIDHLGIVQAAGRHADGSLIAAADPAYAGTAAAD